MTIYANPHNPTSYANADNLVACEACRGQGVSRGPQSDMPWFECRVCNGTGTMTEQQARDWPNHDS